MSKQDSNSISNELLAKYFAGEATREESTQVKSWVEASQENQEFFNRSRVIWNDTGVIRFEAQLDQQFDVDTAWDKVQSKKAKYDAGTSWVWKIAASVIIILGIGWLAQVYLSDTAQVQFVAEASIEEVILEDSSMITLNEHSVLTYPESFEGGDTRTVKLEGEAFFKVDHQPEKPFIVNLGKAKVKVLGTSFNISSRMDKDTVAVWVETGKVLFYTDSDQVTLTAGQKGLYLRGQRSLLTAATESIIGTEQFWLTRKLAFSGQTLPEVAESISQAYGVNVILENDAVKNCRLAVTFEDETLEDVLSVIELTLNLSIQQQNGLIIIGGEGCPD